MEKSIREGKVFIDWNQNDDHKTTVNVYSLRAQAQPTVSTPVTWGEVEDCWNGKSPECLRYLSGNVLKRVAEQGDLFEPVLTLIALVFKLVTGRTP